MLNDAAEYSTSAVGLCVPCGCMAKINCLLCASLIARLQSDGLKLVLKSKISNHNCPTQRQARHSRMGSNMEMTMSVKVV